MGTKTLPWFRLYPELISDVKFTVIAHDFGYTRTFAIGLWTILLCVASESPERGKLYAHIEVPLNVDELGAILDIPDDVQLYLDLLKKLGMLYLDDMGAYCVSNWDDRQYTNNPTLRSRKYRENKVATENETEMQRNCNAGRTSPSVSASGILINIFKEYEQEIGTLTATIRNELIEASKEYEPTWIVSALQEAARNNKRNWKYAHAILKRWKVEGFQSNNKNKKSDPDEAWKSGYSTV